MMKKVFFTTFVFLLCIIVNAQNSGKGFQYQAVARDANGNIRKNENIEVKFSLLANAHDGVTHWIETHNLNTDPFGVFSLNIGYGLRDENSTYQNFSELDFRLNNYWL